jgi:hypothetical protein
MPDPNLGEIVATLFENVEDSKPEDNVFGAQLGLQMLKDHGGFKDLSSQGGSVIEETLEWAENTNTRSYGEMETMPTTRVEVFDVARYDWKTIATTVTFSKQELARASGKNAKIELAARKADNAKKSMAQEFNRQFYGAGTGNGGKDINGVGNLVPADPTTGIVGGINRANFPFWRSRSALGTKTTTAYDNLRASMDTIYNLCSKGAYAEHPDWFVFHLTDFGGYKRTLTVNERFISKKEKVDGGWKNEAMAFMGAMVTYDDDISAAGTAWCLNGRNLSFKYLRWLKSEKDVEPANQLSSTTRLWTYGNLGTNNSRRLGTITVIT